MKPVFRQEVGADGVARTSIVGPWPDETTASLPFLEEVCGYREGDREVTITVANGTARYRIDGMRPSGAIGLRLVQATVSHSDGEVRP